MYFRIMKPLDCHETHDQTVGGKKSNSMNAPLVFALRVAIIFILGGVLILSIYNWRHLTLLEREQLALVKQIEQQDEVQKKLLNENTELMAEQQITNRDLLKELENKMLTTIEKKGQELMAEQEKTNRDLLKELENKMLTAIEKKGQELMAEQEKTNRDLQKELENKMLTTIEKKGHSVSHLNAVTPSSGVVHGVAWPTAFVMTCAAIWFLRV